MSTSPAEKTVPGVATLTAPGSAAPDPLAGALMPERSGSQVGIPSIVERALTVGSSSSHRMGCSHRLGALPCLNHEPHEGDGRGCVHHSGSGFPDDE
ncbi:hypothetical protein [Nocardioides pacificus]